MSRRWMCWLGVHEWTPWGRLRINAPGTRYAEGRWCHRCAVAERRRNA